MIYAIQSEGSSHIKFGKAKMPTNRLKVLQTGSHERLEVLVMVDWPDEDERRIHRYLAADRVKGEWFTASTKAMQVIEYMRMGGKGFDDYRPLMFAPINRRLKRALG